MQFLKWLYSVFKNKLFLSFHFSYGVLLEEKLSANPVINSDIFRVRMKSDKEQTSERRKLRENEHRFTA